MEVVPFIRQAMLGWQQAGAAVAARRRIVEDAVGMVELAFGRLEQQGMVELDGEREAALASNLLVVLCSDQATRPIVDTRTLYQLPRQFPRHGWAAGWKGRWSRADAKVVAVRLLWRLRIDGTSVRALRYRRCLAAWTVCLSGRPLPLAWLDRFPPNAVASGSGTSGCGSRGEGCLGVALILSPERAARVRAANLKRNGSRQIRYSAGLPQSWEQSSFGRETATAGPGTVPAPWMRWLPIARYCPSIWYGGIVSWQRGTAGSAPRDGTDRAGQHEPLAL